MFDVVRKHLLETNAMEEAEELLLRHMIEQSDAKRKTRERRASIPHVDFSKEASKGKLVDSIDALKVSDLLGSIEQTIEPTPPVKTKATRPFTPEIPALQREVSLDTLERLAEEEMFRLEQQKREVQRKLEDRRTQAERERILAELAKQQAAALTPQHIKQEAFDAGSRLQKKLRDLSTQHQEVVSEHKRHSLEAERELQLINQGHWNPATSTLFSSVLRPGQPNILSTTQSNQEHTSLSDELLRKSRVKVLLSSVQTEDSVIARQKRIAQLRDKQQQIQDIEDRALKQRAQQPASPPLVLNRSEPVHVSLDKWLRGGEEGVGMGVV
ncbi:hypothetical protein EON65_29025 [archaeon]|nr:MAG: hypothetical protein EON65_29025 [archaeon]